MSLTAGLKLVVGLGNPGRKYQQTRHNIGFEVLQQIGRQYHVGPGRSKFDGIVSEVHLLPAGEGVVKSGGTDGSSSEGGGGVRTLLLMPHTYMNASGGSVRQTIDFYKIKRCDLLVVCDDFHLDLGSLRIRPRGTDGGQKGLADIIQKMGGSDFSRLRVGIGPVPERWNPVDFVLGKFGGQQQQEVEEVIARTVDAVHVWATEGAEIAMNRFNSKKNSGH